MPPEASIRKIPDVGAESLLLHDSHAPDPSTAFALSRLSHPETLADTPIGIFRDVQRPSYDRLMAEQLDKAVADKGPGDLATLITGNDTWTIG